MSAVMALDNLAMVGVSHANASLEIREKLSVPNDEAPGFLAELRARELADEALLLSTCNRTELYCMTEQPERVLNMAASRGERGPHGYEALFYLKRGRETIKHAFSVASGLDSMILGEPEILGQMKKAYGMAREEGFTGPNLARLFERTFNVAKRVRTDTSIARESISAPSICARLAREIFGDLESCSVLCIGAGAIVEAALEHFSEHPAASVTVANRTMRNAKAIASKSGAQVIAYEDITRDLHKHDIVITATSSVLPVIGKGALEHASELRKRKPMALFDLAVPRDVEPEAARLEDLFLYTIDDVGKIASANLDKRREAISDAQAHIAKATDEMVDWYQVREAVDIVKGLRGRVETIRDREIVRAVKAMSGGKNGEDVVRELASRLSNRLSNDPMQALGSRDASGDLIDEIDSWYRDDERDK